jgi:phage-related protein
MDNAAAINTNTKILSKIADNIHLTMDIVKDFKDTVSVKMDKNVSALSNLGKSLSKSFSLNALGNKISDTFNKGLKNLATPFKTIGSNISAAFSGLKTKIANLNPIAAVREKLRSITKKPVAAVKTLFGKNDEQLKRKFFSLWSNPKKVAKIWNKEANVNKNMSTAGVKSKADISGIGGALLGVVSKFFTMADKFITKLLVKGVAALHSAIGPYVFLIIGAIVLFTLLFKDEIKKIIPIFSRVLGIAADILDMIKGPLGTMFTNLINIFSNLYAVINTVISGILGGIANTLAGIFTFTQNVIETVNKTFNMISSVLITLLTPIRDVVLALQPVFEGMVNLLRDFIKNPVGTAVEVGKSVVSGFKNLVGGFFGSDTRDEAEGESILENLFTSVKDTLIEVKDYLLGDTFRENLKSTFNYLLDKLYSSKVFKFMEEAFVRVFQFYDEMLGIIRAVKDFVGDVVNKIGSIFDGAGNIAKTIFGGVADVATGIKNKLAGLFSSDTKEEAKQSNPFNEFIKGFEQMRLDTIALLTDIKLAVVSIEKNKIEIGNSLAQNNAQASDGKKTNNLQNITMNYQVDINQVTEKIDRTNEILQGILTNTAITDKGEQKASAVWSI